MAIQLPNAGLGDGKTGDNEFVMWTKVKDNFSNTTHAASRLVGLGPDRLLEYGAFGLGKIITTAKLPSEFGFSGGSGISFKAPEGMTADNSLVYGTMISMVRMPQVNTLAFGLGLISLTETNVNTGELIRYTKVYTDNNTTKDSNGFLKAASPIVKVHADKVVLNEEAEQQNITFKKNDIGDYTITTQSGLSTDGWYLELPKDLNGNPKVAVTLSEVDGVISLKSYKRIFSMETFTFEPDLDNPLDIPEGRWIDLRLNEIPVDPSELEMEV